MLVSVRVDADHAMFVGSDGSLPALPNDEAQTPRWWRSETETFTQSLGVIEVVCSAWFALLPIVVLIFISWGNRFVGRGTACVPASGLRFGFTMEDASQRRGKIRSRSGATGADLSTLLDR
jgi:hypothetical protein